MDNIWNSFLSDTQATISASGNNGLGEKVKLLHAFFPQQLKGSGSIEPGSFDGVDSEISESSVDGISEDEGLEICYAQRQILETGDKLVKRNDKELKISVLAQLFEEIDWACNKMCIYGRHCVDNPGFISFVQKLRIYFWGKDANVAPSASDRRTKMYKILKESHCGRAHVDLFRFSYITECKYYLSM